MTQAQADRRAFIRANTSVLSPALVPEIRLHLADDAFTLWHKTEEELHDLGLPPPFWAFAWAGGQALARHVLDHPELVAGRQVLDLASGSGLVAIAAKLAGADQVFANDIDPYALEAITINARLNKVELSADGSDYLACDRALEAQTVLAGDIFYDREMAERFLPRLVQAAGGGQIVLVGDPGRAYLPREGLTCLAEYTVPASRALEDDEFKRSRVFAVVQG